MANSNLIIDAKNRIIKKLIDDVDIVKAINGFNGKDIVEPEDLIYTHIFPYHQNPETLKISGTFITLQVDIPPSYFDKSSTYLKFDVVVYILSHFEHQKITNIPKVVGCRNDYLSVLIDKKLNGADFGLGGLDLVSNEEGAYQKDYLWRKLVFETKDLNNSPCNQKDDYEED